MYNLEYAIIELTNRCNLNCLICGSDSRNVVDPNEFSVQEWMPIVDEMKDLGLKRLVLSGGEPTLKPGIGYLIDYINASGIEYGIISNGLEMPENVLYAIKEYPPFVIGISIDGDPETHDSLRGRRGSFASLFNTIKVLQNNEIPVSVNTTVHRKNILDLPWIANFLKENKIYGWQIQLAMPFGRMERNQGLLLSQEEFAWVCVFVAKAREVLPEIRIQAADDFAYAPAGIIRDCAWEGCSAGISSLGIDALGNVKGCLSLTGSKPEGNLRDKRLYQIWGDKNCFSYNRQFCFDNLPADCKNCEKGMICKGGCNSQSFSMKKRYNSSPFCFYKTVMNEQAREVVTV